MTHSKSAFPHLSLLASAYEQSSHDVTTQPFPCDPSFGGFCHIALTSGLETQMTFVSKKSVFNKVTDHVSSGTNLNQKVNLLLSSDTKAA